jgi:hypothetical protein
MGMKETGWEGMDCMYLAEDRGQWWVLMSMVLNLGFCTVHGIPC